jgi:hypothetical protein
MLLRRLACVEHRQGFGFSVFFLFHSKTLELNFLAVSPGKVYKILFHGDYIQPIKVLVSCRDSWACRGLGSLFTLRRPYGSYSILLQRVIPS